MNVGGSSDAAVRAVAGIRGYGKSTHVIQLLRLQHRTIIYDSLGNDYNHGVVVRDWDTLRRFWRRTYRGPFQITYKPPDPMEHFADWCSLVYECGDCTAVIDEVQLYFRGAWCCPELTKLITAGGHTHVELIGVTQAPKRLGELLRSQARIWDVFALWEESHIDYIVTRCPGVPYDTVRSLPKYQYVHYVDGEPFYEICQDDPQTGRTAATRHDFERDSQCTLKNETPQL